MYRPWKLELQRGKIVENSNIIILWPNIWTLLHLVSDSTQETKPFCCLNSDSVHLTNCILRISLPNLFYEFILQTLREIEAPSLSCDPAFPADHVSWLHLLTMSQPYIPVVLISQPHCFGSTSDHQALDFHRSTCPWCQKGWEPLHIQMSKDILVYTYLVYHCSPPNVLPETFFFFLNRFLWFNCHTYHSCPTFPFSLALVRLFLISMNPDRGVTLDS